MNYIGRKYTLLPFLQDAILSRVGRRRGVFCDIFAGTGVVGHHFKSFGFKIVANDIQYYAYCLNKTSVCSNRAPRFANVARSAKAGFRSGVERTLTFLNRLPGIEGFIFQNYCPGGSGSGHSRMYFSDDNGKRCDAIRKRIETWHKRGKLTEGEYVYLIASLLDAADRVANTASVYAAYLKRLKKTALKPLTLEAVPLIRTTLRHKAYNEDGLDLVKKITCDVLYMDPPYNQRQYCSNYHILETIARFDKPKIYGVTGLRPHQAQKSSFCVKAQALSSLEKMVHDTVARHVFLSYNSEGIMSREAIWKTLEKFGSVDMEMCEHSRFRADLDSHNRVYKSDRVNEYLFCLRKDRRRSR
jgi:adenine-specific DNA-methyltransferase